MKFHYTECGLDYIYLNNGFAEHETKYGAGYSIRAADLLDAAIAHVVLRDPARLCGQDVRFIRALMDLSQNDLARKLGVQRLTVARWETKPNTPIPGASDRLIRLMYFLNRAQECQEPGKELSPETLAAFSSMVSVLDGMDEIGDYDRQAIYMTYLPERQEGELPMFDDNETEAWQKVA